MKDTVIFDIDGTLADCSHRLQHIRKVPGLPPDWDAFYRACGDDTPIEAIADLLDIYIGYGYRTMLVTGRPEKYRRQTLNWLEENVISMRLLGKSFDLRMRADGDFRPDYEVKSELVSDDELAKTLFIVEDRDQVVKMWRKRGALVLQCADGSY